MFSGTKCLSFVNIPIFLEIVFEIASMWFFHVRFSSIITPKNFVELTLFKDTPSSLTLSLTFSTSVEPNDSESVKISISWFISMNFFVLWWVPSKQINKNTDRTREGLCLILRPTPVPCERVQIHARENLCSYATNPPHFCVRELLLCDI